MIDKVLDLKRQSRQKIVVADKKVMACHGWLCPCPRPISDCPKQFPHLNNSVKKIVESVKWTTRQKKEEQITSQKTGKTLAKSIRAGIMARHSRSRKSGILIINDMTSRIKVATVNSSVAVKSRDHFKNGVSSKSQALGTVFEKHRNKISVLSTTQADPIYC